MIRLFAMKKLNLNLDLYKEQAMPKEHLLLKIARKALVFPDYLPLTCDNPDMVPLVNGVYYVVGTPYLMTVAGTVDGNLKIIVSHADVTLNLCQVFLISRKKDEFNLRVHSSPASLHTAEFHEMFEVQALNVYRGFLEKVVDVYKDR